MYAPPLMRHESSPLPMSQPANMAAIDSLYANDLARRLSITGSTSEDIISSLRSMNLHDDFWLYSFKVTPCAKTFNHRWTACPCAHQGETARRRDPRLYPYRAVLCPMAKMKKPCPMGDNCMWSHNVFEHWLHPSRFKTRLCSFGPSCTRPICFFAHHPDELRTPPMMGPDAEGAGRDVDEREYLVQLLMAQQAQGAQQGAQVHASAMSMQMPAAMPYSHNMHGMQGMQGMMPMMAPAMTMQPQLAMQQAGMQLVGMGPRAGTSMDPRMMYGGGMLPMSHMADASASNAAAVAAAGGGPRSGGMTLTPRQSASGRQSARTSAGTAPRPISDPNVDAATLLLGLQESLASLQLGGDGEDTWPGGAHSRLSDPGLAGSHQVSPIRHLNRISDSGQTLALHSPKLLDLEVLLNNALAAGQAAAAGGSRGAAGGGGGGSAHSSMSGLTAQSSQGDIGDSQGRSDSPVAPHSHPASATGSPLAQRSGQGQGADGGAALPNSTRAMIQALGGADACVQALVSQLQQQGIVASKDQLVMSLTQLLTQLLTQS